MGTYHGRKAILTSMLSILPKVGSCEQQHGQCSQSTSHGYNWLCIYL
jgi:hypothetical protein